MNFSAFGADGDGTRSWVQAVLSSRLFLVGGIGALMLVPLRLVQGTLAERAERHEEAIREVTTSWGGDQALNGPWLLVPEERPNGTGKEGWWVIGPDELKVEVEMAPKTLRRGIHGADRVRSPGYAATPLGRPNRSATAAARWRRAP